MKNLKKLIASAALLAMAATSPNPAEAANYNDCGGCGYNQSRGSCCMTPAIVLGTIAVLAIIAVAVGNSQSGHCHCTHCGA